MLCMTWETVLSIVSIPDLFVLKLGAGAGQTNGWTDGAQCVMQPPRLSTLCPKKVVHQTHDDNFLNS